MGQYYQPPPPGYGAPQPEQKNSGMAVAGGVLILIAGILGMLTGVMMFFINDYLNSYGYGGMEDVDTELVQNVLYVCGSILIIFGIIAMLGGVMAMKRKKWGLAVLGGIMALFCIGPYGLASLLGLIGLILVLVSRHDFEGQQRTTPQVVYVQAPQAPPPPPVRLCLGCGRQINESYNVCPHCGRPAK